MTERIEITIKGFSADRDYFGLIPAVVVYRET